MIGLAHARRCYTEEAEGELLKRIFRLIIGIVFLLLGIAGAILPIIPGFVFLIPGLLILAEFFPPARRLVTWVQHQVEIRRKRRESAQGSQSCDAG
jgi:UPF0716 family protein affecting phage T7 exclusion